MEATNTQSGSPSRRDVLAAGAATAASAALFATGNYAFAQGSDKIKVGVIGCGGRGADAANNVTSAANGVEIWSIGDMFKFQVDGCRNNLKGLKEKLNVTDDRCFSGLDNYKGVLASGCNYVILATPPGFRPIHFEAAIAAGKHVFMEKPVATDGPGIRKVLAAGEVAAQKKLGVVAGTQRRHQNGYIQNMEKIREGAIGDIVGGQCYWNGGGIWFRDRQAGMTDLEYQCWNWYHYTWACGDHICEQHIHNIDVMNWAINAHPVTALAVGGRSQRTDPKCRIFDHFAVDFEYPRGVRILSMCRHWGGTPGNVSERIVGTKGVTNGSGWIGGANEWRYTGEGNHPYVQEHTDLIASIRAGKPLNETKSVAESTLSAIMGRMAAYTGQVIKWDDALNSPNSLLPDLSKPNDPIPEQEIAIPGQTKIA